MSEHETPPLTQSPGLPKSPEGEPVFAAPWMADAFAMVVGLYEKGIFDWDEWTHALSMQLNRRGRAEDGSDYFDCWVAALSNIIVDHGIVDVDEILDLQQSWQRAAEATPHGHPIELANDPLR
ncbi:nitrile hydratase [Rhizobium sp. R634]|uniref:nitrile hydratase accessory protein n=1 Tax=unclassified Rhizobium TaxID=2613769 RepID=UPI000B537CA4|nr:MULTISPECIES: nitrile hydratase accessory protein [unclassified Rhizobium]OWV76968.1 nitrile hydratase [Rhizobium sp. R339]OWV78367.1 nitrile hydratase [Rhizobium sp. R634]